MHPPPHVPSEEIHGRIRGLQREMTAFGVQGVLIAHRMDLLYFSGCSQNAYLYVPRTADPVLLVRKHGPRAGLDSPLPQQRALSSVKDIPHRILEEGLSIPEVLGMAWDALPVREFRWFRRLLPARVHVDVSRAIHRLRTVKSAWELSWLAESARVCEKTLDHLRHRVRPGMSRTRLAGLSEAFARRLGHGGGVRVRSPSEDDRSSWAFGDEVGVPAGQLFACGFRAVVNGYHAAACRLLGTGSLRGADGRAADALVEAHARTLSDLAPCATLEAVAAAVRLSAGEEADPRRGFGCRCSVHGIGLEVREPLEPSSLPPTRGQGICLVLDTRLDTPSGRTLCVQDTLVAREEGLRPLRSLGV